MSKYGDFLCSSIHTHMTLAQPICSDRLICQTSVSHPIFSIVEVRHYLSVWIWAFYGEQSCCWPSDYERVNGLFIVPAFCKVSNQNGLECHKMWGVVCFSD